ncbi:MAG: SpoIIE family protein phosphatase [Planctomycetota bacterium]
MDTPGSLVIRRGRALPLPYEELCSPRHAERTIRVAEFKLEPEDRILLYSDGLTQAGLGSAEYPLGWRDAGCRDLALSVVERQPEISARQLSRRMVSEALRREPDRAPGDDMTCGSLYLRRPRRLTLFRNDGRDRGAGAESRTCDRSRYP